MGSISKCQKLYKEQNGKQCEDRISNLPSTLISRILSLLPTKYAVATSVLSSQWKLHWTLITSLDLDDKLLLQPEKSTDKTLQTCFANFVYRVLILRRESCLRMFRLKGCQSFNASLINTWVAVSLVCGVQELDLSIRINERTDHVLPQDLFTSRTMVVLKLDASFVMNVPTSVRMQSLKILHLHSVELIDDDSIYSLICGCPVLDELSMEGCVGEHVRVIHIFAPVLTKLLLKCLDYLDESKNEVPTHEIVLDTPALLYLVLENSLDSVEGYLVKNLSRLITVNIDIRVSFGTGTVSKCATDLFVGISSVQCLHLHSEFIMVLDECNYQLPMFHNLTSLELDSAFVLAWEAMLRLSFFFHFICKQGSWSPWDWNPPQNVPKCLGSHLQVVEIFNFDPREEELKIVEYFLNNGEVLEKLIIHESSVGAVIAVEMANKAQVEGLKELLRFPRGSKVCQIEIC